MLDKFPAELLHTIIQNAYPSSDTSRQSRLYPLLTLNRAIYPVIKQELYQTCYLDSVSKIEAFKTTVEKHGLHTHVRRLKTLSLEYNPSKELSEATQELVDWAIEHLPHMEHFNSPYLSDLCIDSATWSLTSLSVYGTTDGPYDLQLNASVGNITTLTIYGYTLSLEELNTWSDNMHKLDTLFMWGIQFGKKRIDPDTNYIRDDESEETQRHCQEQLDRVLARFLGRIKRFAVYGYGYKGWDCNGYWLAALVLQHSVNVQELHLAGDDDAVAFSMPHVAKYTKLEVLRFYRTLDVEHIKLRDIDKLVTLRHLAIGSFGSEHTPEMAEDLFDPLQARGIDCRLFTDHEAEDPSCMLGWEDWIV